MVVFVDLLTLGAKMEPEHVAAFCIFHLAHRCFFIKKSKSINNSDWKILFLEKAFSDDLEEFFHNNKGWFSRKKHPSIEVVKEKIFTTLEEKISYINAWPEVQALFHFFQIANLLEEAFPDFFFYEMITDLLAERIGSEFFN